MKVKELIELLDMKLEIIYFYDTETNFKKCSNELTCFSDGHKISDSIKDTDIKKIYINSKGMIHVLIAKLIIKPKVKHFYVDKCHNPQLGAVVLVMELSNLVHYKFVDGSGHIYSKSFEEFDEHYSLLVPYIELAKGE